MTGHVHCCDCHHPAAPDLAAHFEAARHDHQMHHHPAGYVRTPTDSRGRCTFRFRWEDVLILCWAPNLPGTGGCLHHLATADVVVFEARVITTTEAGTPCQQ